MIDLSDPMTWTAWPAWLMVWAVDHSGFVCFVGAVGRTCGVIP